MKTYTVKQVAHKAGVSIRTLHHYDQIGLLHPAYVGDNGYRFYTRDELLRLQEILFFKQMGFTLQQIEVTLSKDDAERTQIFQDHRKSIEQESRRQLQLLKTIDRTIADLTGETKMKTQDLYKGFSAEKQAEHVDWLLSNLDDKAQETLRMSKAKLVKDADGDKNTLIKNRMIELEKIEGELIMAMQSGVSDADEALNEPLRLHHSWVAQWWGHAPQKDAYIGLAEMYKSHPDFVQRYEALASGFATYLAASMTAFAHRNL